MHSDRDQYHFIFTDHPRHPSSSKGFEKARKRMVVKSLRYPSGEKSDQYSWSTLPCEAPRPNLSVTYQRGYLSAYSEYGEDYTIFKYKPLDFDGFMDKCHKMAPNPSCAFVSTRCTNLLSPGRSIRLTFRSRRLRWKLSLPSQRAKSCPNCNPGSKTVC